MFIEGRAALEQSRLKTLQINQLRSIGITNDNIIRNLEQQIDSKDMMYTDLRNLFDELIRETEIAGKTIRKLKRRNTFWKITTGVGIAAGIAGGLFLANFAN